MSKVLNHVSDWQEAWADYPLLPIILFSPIFHKFYHYLQDFYSNVSNIYMTVCMYMFYLTRRVLYWKRSRGLLHMKYRCTWLSQWWLYDPACQTSSSERLHLQKMAPPIIMSSRDSIIIRVLACPTIFLYFMHKVCSFSHYAGRLQSFVYAPHYAGIIYPRLRSNMQITEVCNLWRNICKILQS